MALSYSKIILSSLLYCATGFGTTVFTDSPRLFVSGVAGSREIGSTDILLPVVNFHDAFIYTDMQARVGSDNAWLASGGIGYRGLRGRQIYGGYLFLDRNVSVDHNVFWILSPGLEILNRCWDGRINGYIPVSAKRQDEKRFFPSDDTQNPNFNFIEFKGHQQFEHRFAQFEEVGPGIDAEIGFSMPQMNNLTLHGGGYLYHLEDATNIKGIAARAELPMANNFALTLAASYDNYQHGAVVGGIRIQLGHAKPPQLFTICDRFYDPVTRHLATLKTGSGIPIERKTKDEGLFLRRDNIFFFTGGVGAIFDGTSNSGTFENPLAATELNQGTITTVSLLAANANFYLAPGIYVINSNLSLLAARNFLAQATAPNARIELLQGQSIFGRANGFKSPVLDNNRPVIVGGIDLFSGNNVIEAIQLQNQTTEPGSIVGLDIQNASNIVLSNDVFNVSSFISGDNTGINNSALGILVNNSEVTMLNSALNVSATVTGNSGFNQAVGIGNIDDASAGNHFIIKDSVVEVTANTGTIFINGSNLSVGIGVGSLDPTNGNQNFANNNFDIIDSTLATISNTVDNPGSGFNLSATIGTVSEATSQSLLAMNFTNNNFVISKSLLAATAVTENTNTRYNGATGIGIIGVGLSGAVTNQNFSGNNFLIQDTHLKVVSNSRINNSFNFNTAAGIGNLIGFGSGSSLYNQGFINNIFAIDNAFIDVNTIVQINNSFATNSGIAIGNNSASVAGTVNNSFVLNDFSINKSQISAAALVENNLSSARNISTVVGFSSGNTVNNFNDNLFTIQNSILTSIANVRLDNSGLNESFGFNVNTNNIANVSHSEINSTALIGKDNLLGAINHATGISSGTGNVFNFIDDQVNVKAIVAGINSGSNSAS